MPLVYFGFYSLHRETYSVTGSYERLSVTRVFLFAASRDVQRDVTVPIALAFLVRTSVEVSIRCIARRTA